MIAVIGSGYWGKNLVRVFYELETLSVICETDIKRAEDLQKDYPGIPVLHSYEDVLKHPDVQAVVIATPAVQHFLMAKKAMEAGKDVYVEKPLSFTVSEGQQLVDLAQETQKILMVGHILQYHPAVIKLKTLIESGELGKVEYLYSNRLNIGKIRSEENILWSFAPHDISVILMLLGELPHTIQCSGGSYLQQNIVDTTMTNLQFPGDVKAHIFVSWLHPYKEQKLIVVGDEKMAVFDDMTPEKLFIYPHKIEWKNRLPIAEKAEAEPVAIPFDEPLKNECKHFLECLKNRKQPRTDGAEGLRVLRVLDACQKSLNDRGHSVSLLSQDKYFVHESSYVDDHVCIGEGTAIWHFSHILAGSKIGKKCRIGQNVVIGPKVTIGNNVKIQNNVSVYEEVTLEDDVFCGPSMVFTNVINPRSHVPRKDEYKKTLVKKGASIGANTTVVCGHTIGEYAFIGAGAVVTKDVPAHALVVGNPGRIIGWMCDCGVKLNFTGNDSICSVCGKEFAWQSGRSIKKK